MKTASNFSYFGPGRVGIARGAPRRCPAGYRLYRPLAPRRDMLQLPYEEFREIYLREILAPLDAQTVVTELQRLAGEHEPVLQCFEKPPLTVRNWCHRRIVAGWFRDSLGLQVPEYSQ